MAPTRRKGGKAAAAAAARRQWKVGDLVLAKVKGFPAWPATVSEPEKWGYPPDWKKVLVYFFGTQQIAFCNPADVEAFTEEKKQSLLVKRQGKGADFVRALQEIIDSYEKLKRQNQLDEFNSGEEVVRTNGGNSSESLAQFEAKDQAETSEATVMGRNEPRLLTGDAPTEGLDASLDEKETLAEQCNDGIIVTGKTVLATYTSRKRSAGSRPRKRVTQKKTLSAERPGNSAVVDSSRFQNFLLSSDEGNKTSGDASSNLTRSASLRRNKRIRKSPNVSDWEDVDSSTFIPNGSVEDDGSEIATVESDSFSLNEGSGVDSGCKLEHSDTFVECLEEDVQLSKAVVIKKKRKLNRKPSDNETAQPAARQEAMVDLELRVHNSSQDSQTACENSSERYNREDGDEHLPLVKRARVRMSKSSFMEEDHNMSSQAGGKLSNEVAGNLMEENNSFCQAEDRNSDEAVAGILEQMASSANRSHGFSADRDSAIVNVALDIASSPKDCAEILENQVQLSRVEENQSVCCSADEEAALPPSKRLHRALEAMSANVAEECNEVSETLSAKAANSDVSPASMAIPSDMDDKSKVSHSSQDNCLPSNVNVVSVFSFSSNAALVERTTCIQSIESPKRKEHEKTLWVNAGHKDDGKDPSGSCFDGPAISSGDAKAPNPVDLTPTLDRSMTAEQCEPGSSDCLVLKNECSSENLGVSVSRAENPNEVPAISSEYAKAPNPVDLTPTPHRSMAAEPCEPGSSDCLVLKNECSSENIGVSVSRAENPDEELDILEHSGKSPEHHILEQLEAQAASQNGVEVVSFGTDNTGKSQEHNNAVCETTESWRSQIDENNQANDKIEVVEEVKQGLRQNEAVSVSSSEDLVGDRDTLSLRSSPAEAEAAAQTWPPTVCHVSTEESTNGNQSCSSLSPNTLLCRKRTLNDDVKAEFIAPQRPKSVGKGSNSAEVYASLSSFEGMLVSLTRTKESIGRATRMAIDCAKLGVSAKVVEILVRTLENESSLHRRVDLFFLVDSITQCSRGLKSDVGGVYPPAIEAVLPRLLASAAPPGNFATDNRRQCMKVLRLWLDRRVLPESIVRHHMRELDMLNASSSAGPYARRSARTERALDDPIRDMEGMQVDEYGSNSSFQLPGFCMPRMLKDEDEDEDEGSDSDGESFEAVTPEHNPEFLGEREIVSAAEKHTHILEEVDGELEMEDVAPSCVIEMNSTSCATGVTGPQGSHEQFEECSADHFAPPLPPSSPPLPSSPPPPPPPPPPLATGPHPCSIQDDARQPLAQQSAAPRIDPSLHNTAHYPPKCRDQLQMQHCDSTNSFGNYPVHSTDNAQYNDGPSFHHKTYPPRPPHPPPSNHFSYVPPGQHVKSRRETPPPPYSHRFHSSRDADGGNFYSNHERMRPGPYESNDGWRYPPPQFPGPRYHDKPKASFEHVPYGSGPPREPGRHHHHGWGYPRGMHNRNFMPFRPPSEGAVPVSNRASSGWRPS